MPDIVISPNFEVGDYVLHLYEGQLQRFQVQKIIILDDGAEESDQKHDPNLAYDQMDRQITIAYDIWSLKHNEQRIRVKEQFLFPTDGKALKEYINSQIKKYAK